MMTKLRGMTKWIFVVLIVAFLALMVFEWGASGSFFNAVDDSIGYIDGEKITRSAFNRAVSEEYYRIQSNTGQNLDDQQMKELRNQIWETLIQKRVMGEEIAELDISVVEADISNHFIDNPPPGVTQNPEFQTNGVFDTQKYKEALRTQISSQALQSIEAELAERMPYIKLNEYINASVMVTEQELRDEFMAGNIRAKIEFISVPAASFETDAGTLDDGDIRDFYERNKKDFKVEEKRNLNYVLVPASATAADSARIREQAESLKEQALAGGDFAQMAMDRSQDPQSAAKGGDLGYFDKNTMVAEFSEAAFAANPGDIVGPVLTRFGLHIIKVEDKKTEDGVEKIKASHILLNFEASAETRDNAYNLASGFETDAEAEGFARAADKNNLEVKNTGAFQKSQNGYITGIGAAPNISIWAFDSEVGATSRVTPIYTGQGELQSYVVAELTEVLPAGHRPFDEVKDICRSRLDLEKRKEMAKEFAQSLKDRVMSASDFAAFAENESSEKVRYDSTGMFARFSRIPKIGFAPAINAAAFSLPVGGTSGLLENNNGFFFIRVKERQEFNEETYAAQKNALRTRLTQQKTRSAFTDFYNNLKNNIEVKDRRYLVYSL